MNIRNATYAEACAEYERSRGRWHSVMLCPDPEYPGRFMTAGSRDQWGVRHVRKFDSNSFCRRRFDGGNMLGELIGRRETMTCEQPGYPMPFRTDWDPPELTLRRMYEEKRQYIEKLRAQGFAC